MYDVTMPKFSDSMEEGKIIRWRVKTGDEVREGDVLAEIESDKAVMELESYRSGVVAEILHGDETEVAVGEVIARIGAKGEAVAPASPDVAQPPPAADVAQPPPAADVAQPPSAADVAQPPSAADVAQPPPRKRVRISPAARKLAQQRGINHTTITGTGPGGRIVARKFKTLLPTYDVFDEARYFEPGPSAVVVEVDCMRLGLSICEDIWIPDDPAMRQL